MSLLKLLLSSGGIGIADLFQVDTYTGNGTSQNIVNGLDLTNGFVWIKNRDAADSNILSNTVTGIQTYLRTDVIAGGEIDGLGNFVNTANADGFSIGNANEVNTNTENYVSWSFKLFENFCDVVNYTGTGSSRTVPHSLNSVPGFMFIRDRVNVSAWFVYHTARGNTKLLLFNAPDTESTDANIWDSTDPTSTEFTLGASALVNTNTNTYTAFLLSEDNPDLMQFGEYTGNGSASGPSINLGWQPQFVMIKRATVSTGSWQLMDSSRGEDNQLLPNSSAAETSTDFIDITATGFDIVSTSSEVNTSGSVYIYMAIRAE